MMAQWRCDSQGLTQQKIYDTEEQISSAPSPNSVKMKKGLPYNIRFVIVVVKIEPAYNCCRTDVCGFLLEGNVTIFPKEMKEIPSFWLELHAHILRERERERHRCPK